VATRVNHSPLDCVFQILFYISFQYIFFKVFFSDLANGLFCVTSLSLLRPLRSVGPLVRAVDCATSLVLHWLVCQRRPPCFESCVFSYEWSNMTDQREPTKRWTKFNSTIETTRWPRFGSTIETTERLSKIKGQENGTGGYAGYHAGYLVLLSLRRYGTPPRGSRGL
jgi:hypothetical protein